MVDTTAIKNGIFMMFNDAICLVVDFQHVNPGKGSAFVRTRLKNVQTGKVIEHTYKAGEAIEVVELEHMNMQYLYKDSEYYYFMDNRNYEQHQISEGMLGEKGEYLKEGQEVVVLLHEGIPLSVDLPKKITLKVTETMDAVRGDTSGGRVLKEATVETGMKVQVPLFIKEGDMIVLNTETAEYVERA
jgi:elongation factor P